MPRSDTAEKRVKDEDDAREDGRIGEHWQVHFSPYIRETTFC